MKDNVESYLSTDHHCSSHVFSVRIGFDPVVQGDNVKHVQQLSFVFVNSFHLHVEQRHGIDLLMLSLRQPFSETMFVLLFHLLNVSHECIVVHKLLQTSQIVQIGDPILADFLTQIQPRVMGREESSLTSAIASLRFGLLKTNQRRGVIPLVLFWNLSGVNS